MTNEPTQKIAWVTGINQGIGAQIMQQLLDLNIRVIGFDQSLSQCAPDQPDLYQCDVGDHQQVSDLCQRLIKTAAPDYFIHAAGVLFMGPHDKLAMEHWTASFAVNVSAPFYFLRHLSAHFKKQRQGSIVMISSNAAHAPRIDMAAYGASKSALTSFTQTVGLELAEYGVRVNIVSPGSTSTQMLQKLWADEFGLQRIIQGDLAKYKVGIPLQKVAQTVDIANAVMFLISDQASHITMHDLVVDGGATLGR